MKNLFHNQELPTHQTFSQPTINGHRFYQDATVTPAPQSSIIKEINDDSDFAVTIKHITATYNFNFVTQLPNSWMSQNYC